MKLDERYLRMAAIWTEKETMLKLVLDNIKVVNKSSILGTGSAGSKSVFGSKELSRFSNDLYIDTKQLDLQKG